MNCPLPDVLLRAELGDVTVNDARAIDEHVAGCAKCRADRLAHRTMLADLAAEPAQLDDAFVTRVMTACDNAPAHPVARRRHVGTWAALAVAAGVAAYLVRPSPPVPVAETWTPRGGIHATQDEPVGVEILVARPSGASPLDHAVLVAGDGFSVRYWNTTGSTRYLAAFAIDAEHEIHWIYPAYLDEADSPSSVPLAPAERRMLEEAVEPESPSPGPMRVVAIVTDRPLSVRAIEETLSHARPGSALADVFAPAHVREWSVTWDAR